MPKIQSSYTFSSQEKYKRVIAAVHMVYRLVNSTYNTRELLIRLTRIICQLVGASSSYVHILEENTRRLKLIAVFNGKVNILLSKKCDLKKVSKVELDVSHGGTIVLNHLVGLPLVSDENIGAIFMKRKKNEAVFEDFDREVLAVVAEQIVTAVKNIQLYEQQQKVILDSIRSMGKFFEQHRSMDFFSHAPIYYKIVTSLAESLHMTDKDIETLQYACVLHDTGSVDVPYQILAKKSRLSAEEFRTIRNHPQKSVDMIKPVAFLKPVLPVVLYHHERYDGNGYPSGLKGEEIPFGARVMAVADAFAAMVSDRPYKKGLSCNEALGELKKESGIQFDPKVVNAFCKLAKKIKFRKYLSLMAK
ncbi:MAG: HD domain-containing phosphohydrolase [Candidatus Aceula meridiana]|nr:HD domain-containing phosphohydrolase [Candidatus Aceula meridiana]